jgi:hypothetical protein
MKTGKYLGIENVHCDLRNDLEGMSFTPIKTVLWYRVKPGCQARAISMCFSSQQPLPETFIPQASFELTKFQPGTTVGPSARGSAFRTRSLSHHKVLLSPGFAIYSSLPAIS